MSDKTISELIHIITWDRRIVKIPDEINSTFHHCMLKIPTIEDHNMAYFIKSEVYDQAIAGGAPTEKQLMVEVVSADMWSVENEKFIEDAEDQVNQLESRLLKERNVVQRKRIKREIEEIRGRYIHLQNERSAMVVNSAEYMAHERMILFLISRITLNMGGECIWSNVDEFYDWYRSHKEAGIFLAKHIVNETIMDIKTIRRVARSGEWRLLWSAHSNNIQALFTPNIRELNINQKMLVYWSRVYDNAFESTERPDEETINDDDKFDVWFQNKLEEREERKLNNGQLSKKGKRSHGDHHERGVVIDGYYSDDCTCGAIEHKGRGLGETHRHANNCPYGVFVKYTEKDKMEISDQIYGKNKSQIRNQVNKEQEYVADHGTIEEQKLRNKKSRMILGSDQKVHARKR